MSRPLRLVIADDHALFRQALRSLLQLYPEIEVIAEAERASDILNVLADHPCDALLLDLQMDRPVLQDIEALAQLTRVVVLTANEHVDDALAALRHGARAVVQKRFAIGMLIEAIRAVGQGLVWMPPALQAALAAHLAEPADNQLTSREREIVRYVALGLRNGEVAERLHITEGTVKTHMNNIFHKLTIRDRVELALYAVRTGLITVNEQVR
jgi:two-component system, NarL family, response regulator